MWFFSLYLEFIQFSALLVRSSHLLKVKSILLFPQYWGELWPDSPTYLQDHTIFFIQLNNLYYEKLRCCHLIYISLTQGCILQGIPKSLYQFQSFLEVTFLDNFELYLTSYNQIMEEAWIAFLGMLSGILIDFAPSFLYLGDEHGT